MCGFPFQDADRQPPKVWSRTFTWRETARVLRQCMHASPSGMWQPSKRGFVCLDEDTGLKSVFLVR